MRLLYEKITSSWRDSIQSRLFSTWYFYCQRLSNCFGKLLITRIMNTIATGFCGFFHAQVLLCNPLMNVTKIFCQTLRNNITSSPAVVKGCTKRGAALEATERQRPKLLSFHHIPEAGRDLSLWDTQSHLGTLVKFSWADSLNHLKPHLFTYWNGPSCAKWLKFSLKFSHSCVFSSVGCLLEHHQPKGTRDRTEPWPCPPNTETAWLPQRAALSLMLFITN